MAKMTKARKRQLNRVRRLRKSLGDRGYILPADVWDLNNLSTQKLASMTPDWFYRQSYYKVTAEDYAAVLLNPVAKYSGFMPGDVVSGIRGREIEQTRAHIKADYTYTGRAWERIREAQLRYSDPKDAIGANQAANVLQRCINNRGIDVVEAHIRQMPTEFFKALDDLCALDYESLKKESRLTGQPIYLILKRFSDYMEQLLNRW